MVGVSGMDGFEQLGAPAPKPLVEGLRPSNSPLPRRRVAACGNFETGLFAGKIAAPYAQEFWLNLDDKTRRAMIWDVPMDMRCKALQDCWLRADYVGLAWTGSKASPSMACWLTAIGPGSRCAMAHFCYAKEARPLAMKIGRKMLELIAGESGFQSLLGLLPATYRHAVNFVQRLGFMEAARLAGACPLAGRGIVDGVLVTTNLEVVCCPLASLEKIPQGPRQNANSSAMTLPL